MIELLCPAGSREALEAAVQSGADAVYMGFGAFNARQSAKNFTDEEFASAVSYCHLRGVKVYLTLNTLVTDRELSQAAESLRKAAEMQVDAVLIQDWGIWHLAREAAPALTLHASTQMSIHTLGGAQLAAREGMARVVLARELNAAEIAEICRDCDAEVETFVHGALCYCYSGQCAMSALIGQRSGNRGRCAQPCRLPYGVDGPCKGGHPLSLKDANLSDHLGEMADMGVACLKIEGRMKRPEYVAAVTGIYRRLLDENRRPTAEERQQLAAAFSRDGFTDGYFAGQKGPRMLGMRPENARWPEEWFAQVRREYESREHRTTPVTMDISVQAGQPARLTVSDGAHAVTVTGPVPEAARSRSLTEDELRSRLAKTGGTVFTVKDFRITLDDGLMLSAAALNGLRRDALAALENAILSPAPQPTAQEAPLPPCDGAVPEAPALTVSVAAREQLTEELLALRPETVYIPAEWLDTMDWAAYGDTKFCAVLPRILRTADEEKFRRSLAENAEHLCAVAVGNLGHIPIAEGLGLTLRGDFGLNVFNSRALLFLRELGLDGAAVSFELRHQQIRDLAKYLPCEAIVYGRVPLMIAENCPAANTVGCTHGKGCTLTDRTGARFPALCAYGCRSEIQNSAPLFLADKPEFRRLGLARARLRFTTETPAECVSIARRYLGQGDWTPDNFTRGLFYRGVE